MKFTYLGHSACLLEIGGSTLLFDPFLSGNDQCNVAPENVKCDYILLTHGHQDHFGDTEAIAKANDATVIANYELAGYCGNLGLSTEPMHIGGSISMPFGRVKMTFAIHGSSLPGPEGNPIYLGMPGGFLISAEDGVFYHAGDTGLFGDMKLIGEMARIELACLPIGDRFTMGPEDAALALKMINPDNVVPVHYNTFPMIEADVESFASAANEQGVVAHVLECGGQIEI